VTDNAGATASDDVLVTVSASTTGSSRIEAENYTAMSGVLTENCSEGTLDVGWIDNGDWMDYTVSVPSAGSYAINLRIATPYSGSQLQIKNSGGGVLATVNLPLTGGFQTWQTTTATISLAAGTQTIRLQSTGSGWNINWLEIAGGTFVTARRAANVMVEELATSSVAVFPNPVQDAFTLSLDQNFKGNIKLRVVNSSGAVVREYRLQKTQLRSQDRISLGNLTPGIYILNISTMQGTISKQIIKQ